MPLFEIETSSHIIICWATDDEAATAVVDDAYPGEPIVRLTRRPRDTWVISKSALGLTDSRIDPCHTARECLARASGDKVHAIRLYMRETGDDLERARRVIESNMVMGW
jgi:type IV pilus biogenesis protein CpaD/CtpE